jgi:type I restriction enzyme S subunit
MSGEQIKSGYKRTEVGVIPAEWSAPFLDSLAKRGSGHTPDKKHSEYWNGNIKWISLRDSDALDNLYIDNTAATITQEGLANSSAVLHPAGTVVLSRDAGVGKSAIMKTDMAVSQHFMAWQCGSDLDNVFLYYWLQYNKPEFERIAIGNTIKTIGLPFFKALKVPQPPLIEQREIATALSDVDSLLSKLDYLIAKKCDLKQAAMQQLLTGQTRLPRFSGEWEVKRLGDVADMGSGGTPLSSVAAYYDGDIPWVSISDMTKGGKFIQFTDRCLTELGFANSAAQMFPAGTVLYAMYASLGECSIAGIPICTSQAILGIRPREKLHGEFLFYYLTSLKATVKSLGQQGTQANLNKGMVQNFRLILPSVKEQAAIVAVLSEMDAALAALKARRDKTFALKQGMMHELLTGRIRLTGTI